MNSESSMKPNICPKLGSAFGLRIPMPDWAPVADADDQQPSAAEWMAGLSGEVWRMAPSP